MISNCEVDKRSCVSVALDRLHKLYIDYYDNHLSLYLEDLDNDRWTEILSDKLALRIIDKESLILSTHRNQIKFCELTDKQKRDTLVQTAIHSAYNAKQHNRGSPKKVLGKTIDDDFML